MRVVLACIRYPPAPGGAEAHVAALAEGLQARGHDVVVHTSDLRTEYPFRRDRAMPAQMRGVRVVRHRAMSPRGPLHYVFLPTMLRALSREARTADVLHAHSYGYFPSFAAARAADRTGTPLVFTPHFHPPWSMEGGAARRTLRQVYDPTLGRYVLERTDRLIAVSTGELHEMTRFLPVPAGRSLVIPNGFHQERFEAIEGADAFRDKAGVPRDAPLVLYAGRLASNKGLHVLVDAFQHVVRAVPGARLVLAGEDQGLQRGLEAQARREGVADHVAFTGHLDEDTYRAALRAADVFALPSEWEAFGIVLAEAMASGTPCVATRVGGAPDVVDDGETGHLVPYGAPTPLADAIVRLLQDDALRARMGEAARARAFRLFSWDSVVERTIEEYRALVDGAGGA